jgi:hypothetical protein
MAVCDKELWKSTDGKAWTRIYNGLIRDLTDITSIAYGNGKFIMGGEGAGDGQGILYSTDNGGTWNYFFYGPFAYKSAKPVFCFEDEFYAYGYDDDDLVVTARWTE